MIEVPSVKDKICSHLDIYQKTKSRIDYCKTLKTTATCRPKATLKYSKKFGNVSRCSSGGTRVSLGTGHTEWSCYEKCLQYGPSRCNNFELEPNTGNCNLWSGTCRAYGLGGVKESVYEVYHSNYKIVKEKSVCANSLITSGSWHTKNNNCACSTSTLYYIRNAASTYVEGQPMASSAWHQYNGRAISGRDNRYVYPKSRSPEECKKLCLTERAFYCRSFDWISHTRQCQLSAYYQGQYGVRMTYSRYYTYYQRSNRLSLGDCQNACRHDRSCKYIVHYTACYLYHSPCSCGYNRYQRYYEFRRTKHANELSLYSGTYHLSTCAAKCDADANCNEFTVRVDGRCQLWKSCPKVETVNRISDHYIKAPCQMIDRCMTDPNTVSNASWNTTISNNNPTRGNTKQPIPAFKFSNPDCKLLSYTLMGHDINNVWISGNNVEYKTNIKEPFTHKFDLIVTAMGGSRFGKFPSTIKLNGCPYQPNTISIRPNGNWPNWTYTGNTRNPINYSIPGFSYSNPYCLWLKYTIDSQDPEAEIKMVGTTVINYKTAFREPHKSNFVLKVHAIGGTRTQTFKHQITINNCAAESQVITIPTQCQWRLNLQASRQTCHSSSFLIAKFEDKAYSAEECAYKCFARGAYCNSYVVGRSDGKYKGRCYIYKGSCSGSTNSLFDRYRASDTCTQKSGYNQYSTNCRAIMHKETCLGKDSW